MKRFKSIQNKIILISIILSMLGQLVFFVTAYKYVTVLNTSGREVYENNQFKYLSKSIDILFDEVYILNKIILEQEFQKYVIGDWNLKNEKIANLIMERINKQMNQFNLSSDIFKGIYLLGSNSNQRSFGKRIGKIQTIENLPNFDELEIFGLESLLCSALEHPKFIEPGEATNQVKSNLNKPTTRNIDKEAIGKVMNFAKEIENSIIVYNNFCRIAFITIIKPENIKNVFLNNSIKKSDFISIIDKDNLPIYSDLPLKNVFKNIDKEKKIGEWESQLNEKKYIHRLFKMKRYDLSFIYSIEVSSLNYANINNLNNIGEFSFLAFLFAILISIVLSKWLTRPFREVSHEFSKKTTAQLLEELPKRSGNKWISKLSLKVRITIVLLFSVFCPLVANGISISIKMDTIANNNIKQITENLAGNIATNVSEQMKYFRLLTYFIDNDSTANYLRKIIIVPSNDNVLADIRESINANIAKMHAITSSFTNFVLLNTIGESKYQSSYLDNSNYIKVESVVINESYIPQKENIFWKEIEGIDASKKSLSLVRKIYDTDDNNPQQKKVIGFFEMVLEQQPFRDLKYSPRTEFVIINAQGKSVSCSTGQEIETFMKEGMNIFNLGFNKNPVNKIVKIADTEYLTIMKSIPSTGWKLVLFHSISESMVRNNSIWTLNLFIMVFVFLILIFAAFAISQRMLKPLHNLEQNMLKIGRGDFDTSLKYNKGDEISELIDTYNIMIRRINSLIKENERRILEEQELRTRFVIAKLNELQQQINPHFLYNALELINLESLKNKDNKSSKMARALAKMFRYNLGGSKKTVIFKEEIEHTKIYIEVQELRFEGKFNVIWKIEPKTMDIEVIRLMLQPIVENVILHAFTDVVEGGEIVISSFLEDEYLKIEVEDNGIGIKHEKLEQIRSDFINQKDDSDVNKEVSFNNTGTGIALRNVSMRLKLVYGDRAGILIDSTFLEWTKVTIKIPLRNP